MDLDKIQITVNKLLDRLRGGFDVGAITRTIGFRTGILSFEKIPDFLAQTNSNLYTFNFTRQFQCIAVNYSSGGSLIISMYFKLGSNDKVNINIENHSFMDLEEITMNLPPYFYAYCVHPTNSFNAAFIDGEVLGSYMSSKENLDFIVNDEIYTLLGKGNFTKGVGR